MSVHLAEAVGGDTANDVPMNAAVDDAVDNNSACRLDRVVEGSWRLRPFTVVVNEAKVSTSTNIIGKTTHSGRRDGLAVAIIVICVVIGVVVMVSDETTCPIFLS